MSNIAQGAACLGVAVALKDPKVRGLAVPSGISALLGITEPAMFGVNLRYRQAFFAADDWFRPSKCLYRLLQRKSHCIRCSWFLRYPHRSNRIALRCIALVC